LSRWRRPPTPRSNERFAKDGAVTVALAASAARFRALAARDLRAVSPISTTRVATVAIAGFPCD
jgi:hypothetical protein